MLKSREMDLYNYLAKSKEIEELKKEIAEIEKELEVLDTEFEKPHSHLATDMIAEETHTLRLKKLKLQVRLNKLERDQLIFELSNELSE